MLPNIGQAKTKKKITWFENPEIEDEPLLTFNRRTHSHVSDIEYYEEHISKPHLVKHRILLSSIEDLTLKVTRSNDYVSG